MGRSPCFNGGWFESGDIYSTYAPLKTVVVLVLMEDGSKDFIKLIKILYVESRSPCFNGGWFESKKTGTFLNLILVVVLVLMEDGSERARNS